MKYSFFISAIKQFSAVVKFFCIVYHIPSAQQSEENGNCFQEMKRALCVLSAVFVLDVSLGNWSLTC